MRLTPTWADCVRSAGPSLSSALISTRALSRVLAIGQSLPALSGGGLECHLQDPDRVDVAVRLMREDGGLHALFDEPGPLRFSDSLVRSAVWLRLRELSRRCLDPECVEYSTLKSLWLEFDAPHVESLENPGIFLGLHLGSDRQESSYAWLPATLAVLSEETPRAILESHLASCSQRLPSSAQLAFVGLMLSRPRAGIRLVWKRLAPGEIVEALRTLEVSAAVLDDSRIASMLPALLHKDCALALHVDLQPDGSVGSTIGLEVSCVGHPRQTPAWQQLLRQLVAQGACSPDAAEAIANWTGQVQSQSDDFSESLRALYGGLARRLNHIKLTFRPQQPLYAKAYLYFGLLPPT